MNILDSTIITNLPYLLTGALLTLEVTSLAIILGLFLGLLLNFMRLSSFRLFKIIAKLYVSIFRGTPLLLQLLVVYYIPSEFNLNIEALFAAVIALALNTSAFQAEIYRGGFNSIPFGQIEAAKATGLSPLATFIHIQVPQVFRLVLPALFNELTLILKASSLISIISVTDLTRRAQQLASTTQAPLEFFLSAAAIYIVISMAISYAGDVVEKKLLARS